MDPHRAGGVDTGPYPVEPLELRRAIAHPIGKDGAVVAGDGRKGERRGPGEQAQGAVPVHGAPEFGVVTEVAMSVPEGHGVAVDVVGLLVTDPVVPGELQRRKHARPDAVLRPGVLVHLCPVQRLHLGERPEGPHDAAQPVGVHQVVVVEEGDDIAGGCIEPRIERRRPTVTGARADDPQPRVVDRCQQASGLFVVRIVHHHQLEARVALGHHRTDHVECPRGRRHFGVHRLGTEVGQDLDARAHPPLERAQPLLVGQEPRGQLGLEAGHRRLQ